MELIIDTSKNQNIAIELRSGHRCLVRKDFKAEFTQAERLLPEIDLLLHKIEKKSSDLTSIKVANKGGSFTALRIGIVTANALAYALDIPVASLDDKKIIVNKIKMAKPEYSSEPNISISKKKLV